MAATAFLAACNDRTPLGPADSGRGSDQVCDEYGNCEQRPPAPGGGINPNDTYVVGDISVTTTTSLTFSQPIYDAATDQETTSLTETSPPEPLSFAGGYGYDGSSIVNTTFTDGPDPGTSPSSQVVEADLAADSLSEINSLAQQIADLPGPEGFDAQNPMDVVGSTQNGDVLAGIVVDMNDTIVGSASISSSRAVRGDLRIGSPSIQSAIARAVSSGPQAATWNGQDVQVEAMMGSRIRVTDLTAGAQNAASGNPGQGQIRRTRSFVKRGAKWVLAEERIEADTDDGKQTSRMARVSKYNNVRWFRNAARDAQRRAARPTTDWMPRKASAAGYNLAQATARSQRGLTPRALSYVVTCGDECNGGGGGGDNGPAAIGADPGCGANITAHVNTSGAQLNILYQHGIWSDAQTWCAMSPYVRSRYVVGNEIRYSLHSSDRYEDQAADLRSRLSGALGEYPGPYVFIGHSNGGIVSRFTGAELGGNPAIIAGVITVSTPNDGAPLARLSTERFIGVMAAAAIPALACNIFATFACTKLPTIVGAGSLGLAAMLAPVLVRDNNPVLNEMTPRNAVYATLNSYAEPYPRAAVINKSWDKWTGIRLLADNGCSGSTPNCNLGRKAVAKVDKSYRRYIKCAVVGGLFGFVVPGPVGTALRTVAAVCGTSAATLKSFDLVYKRVSVGSDSGDGIVPVRSQYYPNTPADAAFIVPDADSHLGVTKATAKTGSEIVNAIRRKVGITPVQ